MIKICGNSLCNSSEMTFKSYNTKGEFPSEWSKVHAVPVHKNKQSLKNYRPISLLLIFGKIFERIMCNNVFVYLTANKLTGA